MAEPTDVSTTTGRACRYRLSRNAGLSGTSTSDAATLYLLPARRCVEAEVPANSRAFAIRDPQNEQRGSTDHLHLRVLGSVT